MDASGNVRLGDIGVHLQQQVIGLSYEAALAFCCIFLMMMMMEFKFLQQIKKHFKRIGIPADVKYIDPTYMIRACRANASDAILCTVLGQNAVSIWISWWWSWDDHGLHLTVVYESFRFMEHLQGSVESLLEYATATTSIYQSQKWLLLQELWIRTAGCGTGAWLPQANRTSADSPKSLLRRWGSSSLFQLDSFFFHWTLSWLKVSHNFVCDITLNLFKKKGKILHVRTHIRITFFLHIIYLSICLII